jgi:carbonic anhydrase
VKKLVRGIHRFQEKVFGPRRELFQRLAGGQTPDALFITCSDSRINPNELTQTGPGELFIMRNAGNIVPAVGSDLGGEGATIEFAVAALGIRDVIVCGHTYCGAMAALLNPKQLETLPEMRSWLRHAEATRRIVEEHYSAVTDAEDRLKVAVEENVLVQLENLRAHPSIAPRLASGQLALHGWVNKIETGDVFAYDEAQGQFVSLTPLKKPDSGRHPGPWKPGVTI